MPDEDDTAKLRALQAERSDQERKLAERSDDDEEQRTHARRSEKAEYLKQKLDEQGETPDD